MKINDVFTQMHTTDSGVSTTTLNRLISMSQQFATPEAFFFASKGELMKAYRRMCPDAKRDLGGRFFDAMAVATRLWRTPDVAAAPKCDEQASDPLDATLTADEVLLLAELMEKFGKPSASVRWMLAQVELARA